MEGVNATGFQGNTLPFFNLFRGIPVTNPSSTRPTPPTPGSIRASALPLWIKVGPTLFACVLFPAYIWVLGAKHLLWLSDIAFLMLIVALWRESPLVNSMIAVGVLPMELAWNFDFFGRILIGGPFLNFTEYMFDPTEPLHYRSLSLFHVLLPALVVYLLFRWGYDTRALKMQSLLTAFILIVTFSITGPQENINWVYGPGPDPQTWMAPHLYFVVGTLVLFFAIMLPTHLILKHYFPLKRSPSTPDNTG